MADKYTVLESNKPIDIVYTLDINEWNGEQTLQLKLIDLKLSE
jgi:single-stranded-DNA-specific exonuclease